MEAPFPRHRRRGLALAVLVSVGSLVALAALARQSPAQLAAGLAGVDPALVALAALLHACLWLAWAARLRVLAHAVGAGLPYPEALRAVLAGSFAASVTPAMLGGEALRGYVLARREGRVGRAGAAVLAERLLDLLAFLGGGAAFALVYGGLVRGPLGVALAAMGALLAFGLGMVGLAVLRPRVVRSLCARAAERAARHDAAKRERWRARAEHEFDRFREALHVLARRPAALAVAAALTVAMWTSEMAVLWVLLRAFGAELPFLVVLGAGMLLLLAMTTPLAPGGSGVAELGSAAVFGALAPGLGPLFPAVWRGCTFYLNLAVGGYCAARLWATPRGAAPTAPEVAR